MLQSRAATDWRGAHVGFQLGQQRSRVYTTSGRERDHCEVCCSQDQRCAVHAAGELSCISIELCKVAQKEPVLTMVDTTYAVACINLLLYIICSCVSTLQLFMYLIHHVV